MQVCSLRLAVDHLMATPHLQVSSSPPNTSRDDESLAEAKADDWPRSKRKRSCCSQCGEMRTAEWYINQERALCAGCYPNRDLYKHGHMDTCQGLAQKRIRARR